MYLKKFTRILISVLSMVLTCTQIISAELPTVKSLELKLQDEIQKVISAGHLRPSFLNEHEYYRSIIASTDLNTRGMMDYWSNPAETIYTLLRALPIMPEFTQQQLREYIQKEWTNYPPYLYTHCGWNNGAAREAIEMPAEALYEYATRKGDRREPGNHDWTPLAYEFNPYNIYVCWMYATNFGNAKSIFANVKDKVQPLPADDFLMTRPEILNKFIAGYIGYLNLQEMAGESRSSTVSGWLSDAYAKRLIMLDILPERLRGIEEAGFLFLVPELGDYLYKHAKDRVKFLVDVHNNFSAPYWFVANMDEVQRLIGIPPDQQRREEGATSLYYAYWSLFQAKAMALKESRGELEKYLDVPSVWRGDLYYIQNLIATIEAPEGMRPTPPRNLREVN